MTLPKKTCLTIFCKLSFESEIISLKLEHQKQINEKSITAGKDNAKLENEKSTSSSSIHNIHGDASSSSSNDTKTNNSHLDKTRKNSEKFSLNITESSLKNTQHNLNRSPLAIVSKPLKENKFTTEKREHLEISGNYDTISDDAIDNSVSSETKSANNDKHDKMVQKSFLHTSIETSKRYNLNSCKYGNQHLVPFESNKEDDNSGDYEPVMGVTNRDKVKHKGQYSHNLNKERTSQSFIHSTCNIAVTGVDTRKEEQSKARSDKKTKC